jgi:hypothetical protein
MKEIKFKAKILYSRCHKIVTVSPLTDNGTRHGRYGTYPGQTDGCNGLRTIPHAVPCRPRGVRLHDTAHISREHAVSVAQQMYSGLLNDAVTAGEVIEFISPKGLFVCYLSTLTGL